MLQTTEKKHEQKIKNVHNEYQTKILAKKDSKSVKDYSVKSSVDQREESQDDPDFHQKQIRKWKMEYKKLKEKYELHVKSEHTKRHQLKEYYQSYR